MKTFAAILGLALMLIMMGADSSIGAQEHTKQATDEADVPLEVRRQIERLRSPDAATRAAAACALGRMESRAAAAVPVLIKLLGDGRGVARTCGHEPPFEDEGWQPEFESIRETAVGEAATQALLAIGEPALEPLIVALRQGADWRTRKNTAWVLAHRGDRRAMREMISALGDEAWQVRTEAAYALFQRGGADRDVVEALIAATRDEVWQVRWQSVFTLGHKGSSTVDVVAPLLGVLPRDAEPHVRDAAAGALWDTADARAFPALLTALTDEDQRVREAAAQTLGNRAGNDEVPALISALKDEDARVRRGARQALGIVRARSQGTTTNLRPLPPGIPE